MEDRAVGTSARRALLGTASFWVFLASIIGYVGMAIAYLGLRIPIPSCDGAALIVILLRLSGATLAVIGIPTSLVAAILAVASKRVPAWFAVLAILHFLGMTGILVLGLWKVLFTRTYW
jgi:hypothetical protein